MWRSFYQTDRETDKVSGHLCGCSCCSRFLHSLTRSPTYVPADCKAGSLHCLYMLNRLHLLRQSHNLQWFIINVKINFRMPLLVFITPAHGVVFLCAVVTCKLMTRFIASGCRHVGFYCSNLCSLQTIPSTQFHLVCMSCVDMHLQRNVKVASLQDSGLSNRNHYHRQQRVISTSPPPKQSKSGWISAVFGEQIRTGSADEFHIDHFWSLPGFWAMRSVM